MDTVRTDREPIVALESTVIAHGLPAPHGIKTAVECERAVQEAGARPATIGIVRGRITIGLSREELHEIATVPCSKVSLSNIAATVANGSWGATTVAATLFLAVRAGISVFSTGGIGGVHRGAEHTFDISTDLTALARYPAIVVTSGAKAILDLPKTLESLETLGVPVIGYQTDEFPAFYSRSSGLRLDLRADVAIRVAEIAQAHWKIGFSTAVVVAVPVPVEAEIPSDEIEPYIKQALTDASDSGITGKAVTPFILARLAELTSQRSLGANIALLKNNARVAAEIACELARLQAS